MKTSAPVSFIFLMILIGETSLAQNLVQNSSFEQYTSCPTGNSGIYLVPPWDVPPGSITTPDYMNSCAIPSFSCNSVSVPDNFLGYAYAADGNGYAGIITFYTACPECREYIQAQLASPLTANVTYTIEVYFRPGSFNAYLTNNQGIYLSSSQISQPGNQPITGVTPQVESAAIIGDTSQWTLVSGTFTALGGEQYVTIGNFHDNANTLIDTVNFPGGSCALVTSGAMYMIDSVYVGIPNIVSNVNFAATDTTLCEKFCISFFDSSANYPSAWQWFFPGGSPSTSALQNPANICYDEPGIYDVTLITTSASGSDTLTLSNYITVYATPSFPTITQVGYMLTSSTATAYQWQFNTVDISGATNQSYTVMQTGYYTVLVYDSNGCVNSATQYVLISGIEEVNDANVFIYPNPSSGNFIVEWMDGLIVGEEIWINVINAVGQKVFSSVEKISEKNFKKEIHLDNVASGVYFIAITSNGFFLNKKIIITQ